MRYTLMRVSDSRILAHKLCFKIGILLSLTYDGHLPHTKKLNKKLEFSLFELGSRGFHGSYA